jgi:hypothetical protein
MHAAWHKARGLRASGFWMLEGEDASRAAPLSALEALRPKYLHFSCHGAFGWDDPAASGLFLSGSDMLTVRDITYETGIVAIGSIPDEMAGSLRRPCSQARRS